MGQNIIGQGLPSYLAVGTKTLSIAITAASTSWGNLKNSTNALSSLGEAYCTTSPYSTKAAVAEFWKNNAMYISKMNIRCSDATYLPTSIKFVTPNIFTGQDDVQVIDVSANIISMQYQQNIVTLNTDIMLGRSTYIDILGTAAANEVLTLDLTITHFASLEVGLQSFLEEGLQSFLKG